MADDKTFTKEELDAAIEKAIGPLKDSVTSLESKRDELITENRKLKRGAEIKPEDLADAEARAEKAEKDLAAAQKDLKAATADRDKAVKTLEGEQGFTNKLLIQDGIKSALIAAGVKDEDYLDTLTAKFSSGAKVVVEGEERKAIIGDKSLADHFKEWAGTDQGKKFIAAPSNSGGGAGGGGGAKVDAKTMTRSAYDALSQPEKSALGPQMAKGELKIVDEAA